jgi:hypothetical protein
MKRQTRTSSIQTEIYVANVPVKIIFKHAKVVLGELNEIIDVNFSDNTPEGQRNISRFLLLKEERNGISIDEALFILACSEVEEHSKDFAARLHVSPSVALQVRIKRNGEISYGKFF